VEFSYWVIAIDDPRRATGYVRAHARSSAAMHDARVTKIRHPGWRVIVELIPAGQAHPDIGPYEQFSRG